MPWGNMKAMRNRLIHGYVDVDVDIVWSVFEKELPPLVSLLRRVLEEKG